MAKPHFTKKCLCLFKVVCGINDYNGFEQKSSFSTKHTVIYHWHDVSTNMTFRLSSECAGFPNVSCLNRGLTLKFSAFHAGSGCSALGLFFNTGFYMISIIVRLLCS